MNVLVWKSYGDVQLYKLELKEGFEKVKSIIIDIVEDYYGKKAVNQFTNSKSIGELCSLVSDACDYDSFEYFEVCKLK